MHSYATSLKNFSLHCTGTSRPTKLQVSRAGGARDSPELKLGAAWRQYERRLGYGYSGQLSLAGGRRLAAPPSLTSTAHSNGWNTSQSHACHHYGAHRHNALIQSDERISHATHAVCAWCADSPMICVRAIPTVAQWPIYIQYTEEQVQKVDIQGM